MSGDRGKLMLQPSEDLGSVLSQESEMSIHLPGSESPAEDECDVIFIDVLDEKYLCSICERILCKPVQFQECGHRACSECFEKWVGETSNCPRDETVIRREEVFTDKAFERQIDSLPVKCSLEMRGCSWTGVLTEIPSHLKICEYRNVACSLKCGEMFEARLINVHEQNECDKRMIQCQFCEKKMSSSMEKSHLENRCPLFPIPCPNKCKMKSIQRKDMGEHIQSQCAKQVEQCQFTFFGCQFQGNMKQMKAHNLESFSKHLMMTLQSFKEKDKKSTAELQNLKMSQLILHENDSTVKNLENQMGPHFIWKIERYSDKLTEAKSGNGSTLFSPKFYTSKHGYCMSLSICLNGDGRNRGEYMSLFVCLCKSEYDALLQWPFNNCITLTLIDQCPDRKVRRNVSHIVTPNVCAENQPFLGRPTNERNACFGNPKFITLKAINQYEYIKNDTIYITVSVDIRNQANLEKNWNLD